MTRRIDLMVLYGRLKKDINRLYAWLELLYKKYRSNSNIYWEYVDWRESIENLLKETKSLMIKYNSLGIEELPIITFPSFKIHYYDPVDKVASIIQNVIRKLEDAYEALSIYIEPQLGETEKQQIDSLRKELEEMKDKRYDELLIKNLGEAVKEIENNHYLASSMIAARVILYCIDQIEGKDDEEKAQLLAKLGVIPKGEKSKETTKWFIKAIKAARNSISHKITVFPSASEAFSILGDSFKIAKLLHQYMWVKNK